MTNQEFREWLRGFFELSPEDTVLDLQQIQVIVNHLNLAEAVEGRLDTENQALRVDIQDFRKASVPQASDFEVVTSSLRQRVLKPD